MTHSRDKIRELRFEINQIKADRIFNRTVNEISAIKGLEFMTDEEYTKFQHKMYDALQEELEL